MKIFEKVKQYSEKPSVMIGGMLLGIFLGIFLPRGAVFYSEVSKLYLSLLEMCALPVMTTAVISSLGHLVHGHKTVFYLKRIFIVFLLGLLLAAAVAILMSVIFRPGGNLSDQALTGIGHAIMNIQGTAIPGSTTQSMGISEFFSSLIPNNVFLALSNGRSLAILFVSVLVGIATGLQRTEEAKHALNVIHCLYLAFIRIIQWIMIFLPIGLLCLFASYIATAGFDILVTLSHLIAVILGCGVLMMLFFTAVIRHRTGYSFAQVIFKLRQPLAMAFFTSSSLATMPTTLNALRKNFKLSEDVVSLVVPLGTNFNQQASVIRYVCIAIFVLQMYGMHLGMMQVPFLVLTAVLAGVASGGMPGIAALSMAGFVLQSLGVPIAVGIILLTVIEPIIDPITTMVNVFGNCMAVTLVERGR
ncbi:MAG: dicarboxylate/amino acid:cation symporter [Gammaproteobacteria bacterium]|jgi:proton glutamate symport protein|nr:dicarboxylate/amino acid:cation symporter [Gammaproteobacteria bacterium]